jgi:hypothetical protein
MADAPTRHRRWYRFTPVHCLLALLAVEGFLLLSERFVWLAFNEKKGWTVLIAVAAVGMVSLVLLLWWAISLLFRWRFPFGIRSLLVLVIAVVIPCGWLAMRMEQAKKQREAVEGIKKVGGWVWYDYQIDTSFSWLREAEPSERSWLRKLVGDDFFEDVVCAGVFWDDGMQYLTGLPELKSLNLGSTQVTDTGLEHLRGLTQLRQLSVSSTGLTDTGMEHLAGLSQLEWLNLGGTQITDEGLEHLEGLSQLKTLALYDTQITDAGLVHLQGLSQLQALNLAYIGITDAGLKDLEALAQLEELDLTFAGVTDAGLASLRGLTNLRRLDLRSTKVTYDGVRNLQQALPNCTILSSHSVK